MLQKWSEKFRQMVQMRQGIPTPNYLNQNGRKMQKNNQNYLKMAQNYPKWPKNGSKWSEMVQMR